MATRKIQTGDAACLYKVAKPVKEFNEKLWQLLDDMAETMYEADGGGLAGPQVGILRRVIVIDCSEDRDQLIEAINPEIIETSGRQGGMEGCLSFPGQSGYVVRPNRVKVEAYDRHGDLYEYEGEGLFARAVFHETDHLDGKVYRRLVTEPPAGESEKE
jgi:peptide deformylase